MSRGRRTSPGLGRSEPTTPERQVRAVFERVERWAAETATARVARALGDQVAPGGPGIRLAGDPAFAVSDPHRLPDQILQLEELADYACCTQAAMDLAGPLLRRAAELSSPRLRAPVGPGDLFPDFGMPRLAPASHRKTT